MLTVGQLTHHLNTLDPTLPIGVIDIDRQTGSQRATITVRALADIDVVHHPQTGDAQAVWLTAHTSDVAGLPANGQPLTVVLAGHPCGCLIPIAVTHRHSVNLDAYPCPHHTPNDIVVRSAQRTSE